MEILEEHGFAKVCYETVPYPDLMDDSDEGGSDRYYLDVDWTRKWFWKLVKRAVGQLKSTRSNRHGQKKRPKKEEEKEKVTRASSSRELIAVADSYWPGLQSQ